MNVLIGRTNKVLLPYTYCRIIMSLFLSLCLVIFIGDELFPT